MAIDGLCRSCRRICCRRLLYLQVIVCLLKARVSSGIIVALLIVSKFCFPSGVTAAVAVAFSLNVCAAARHDLVYQRGPNPWMGYMYLISNTHQNTRELSSQKRDMFDSLLFPPPL